MSWTHGVRARLRLPRRGEPAAFASRLRAALGARPRRLLASIFSRAAAQLAVGLALGVGAATLLSDVAENLAGGQGAVFVSAAAALMLVVALLATLGPVRRGLRIEPMEALRAE